jgi:hypothetical protein
VNQLRHPLQVSYRGQIVGVRRLADDDVLVMVELTVLLDPTEFHPGEHHITIPVVAPRYGLGEYGIGRRLDLEATFEEYALAAGAE